MSLLLYFFLLCPEPKPAAGFPPPALWSRDGFAKAAGLLKGLQLTGFLHKGMTQEEVRQVLGLPSFWAVDSGSCMEAYEKYGIQVFWSNSFAALRFNESEKVEEVRYVWECWLDWQRD